MEIKTKKNLKKIFVQYVYKCDVENCDGEVIYQDKWNLSNPEQYIHKCNKCNLNYVFYEKYPRIDEEYEDINLGGTYKL